MNMKLSVIIPCFNAAGTIAVQLEALKNQYWSKSWEVIISDNGSTDQTVAIAEQYKDKLPNLRVVDSSARRGAAYARNVGALAAVGEAFAFCDADDEVAPGWVAAMGEALSRYDFVACKREYEKLNEPWSLKYRNLAQQEGLQSYKNPSYHLPHASSSTLGVRRSVHEAVGGFDETMLSLEDTDYCWRIQLTGTKLHFVPDAIVHYRYRQTIRDHFLQPRLWGEYRVLLYKKYRPLGMPKLSWQVGMKGWLDLLIGLPRLLSQEGRVQWVRGFGQRVGRLYGSIKYRVLAL